MSFKDYTAPHAKDGDEEGGPITPGNDLCWRINWQDQEETVTPAVLGAVQWALRHFAVTPEQKAEILESLGFEEVRLHGKSDVVIRPKN